MYTSIHNPVLETQLSDYRSYPYITQYLRLQQTHTLYLFMDTHCVAKNNQIH